MQCVVQQAGVRPQTRACWSVHGPTSITPPTKFPCGRCGLMRLQLGGPQPGGGAVHHVGALGPTHLPSFFVALLSVRLSDSKNILGQRDGYSISPKRLSGSTSHKQQKLSDRRISVTAGTQQALGYRCRGQCRRNLMVVHTSAGNLGMF